MSCEVALQALVYDNFAVAFKSHKYHVNVTGEDFYQNHKLLQDVYEKLHEWDDVLCEHIAILGYKVETDLDKYASERCTPKVVAKSGRDMITDLIKCFDTLIGTADYAVAKAQSEKLYAVESSVGSYLEDITKLQWMLKATVK